jgi:hypothetical protein
MSVHCCRLSTECYWRLISVPVPTCGILEPWPRTETGAALPIFLFYFSQWRMSKPFLGVAQSTENSVTIRVMKTGGATLSSVSAVSFRHASSAVLRFVLILLNVVTLVIECLAVPCNTPSVKYIMRDIRPFLVSVRNAHCILHKLPIGSCIVLVELCEN